MLAKDKSPNKYITFTRTGNEIVGLAKCFREIDKSIEIS